MVSSLVVDSTYSLRVGQAPRCQFEATRALVPDALDLPSWLAASNWHLGA